MTEDQQDSVEETRLTPTQWDLFKTEFMKWVNTFGLQRYEIIFTFEDSDDNMATCFADNTGMMAWVNLHSGVCHKLDATDDNIKKVALHEALELLLWDINCMLSETFSTATIAHNLHQVIRVIENMVFKEVST